MSNEDKVWTAFYEGDRGTDSCIIGVYSTAERAKRSAESFLASVEDDVSADVDWQEAFGGKFLTGTFGERKCYVEELVVNDC